MKKLIYKGKFTGEDSLPVREHEEGYVPFKEVDNMKQLALVANGIAFVISVALLALVTLRSLRADKTAVLNAMRGPWAGVAIIMMIVILFPHEIIHALCFKDTVYLYTNFKQGILFVIGLENMTKTRFVLMSLAPNIVFGFIPLLIFWLNPTWFALGFFARLTVGMGAGDYYNVFNCLTQVPRGALVYMNGMKSYWFVPKEEKS